MKPQVKGDKKDKAKVARIDRPGDEQSREAAMRAVEAALEKKGLEPVLLDVREMASYTDFILIVSARSDRQVQAVADNVAEVMKKDGRRTVGTEGISGGHWSLLDFGDVIVHVFYHPVREYYDLEGLWSDADRVPLEIPPDARVGVDEMYDMRKPD